MWKDGIQKNDMCYLDDRGNAAMRKLNWAKLKAVCDELEKGLR